MFKFFKNKIIKLLYKTIELIERYEYRKLNLDENDVSKKILETIRVSNIKVNTDTGFQPISELHITQPYTHYILKTNDFELSCADNHIVFDNNMNEIFVKDLKIGSFKNNFLKNFLERLFLFSNFINLSSSSLSCFFLGLHLCKT